MRGSNVVNYRCYLSSTRKRPPIMFSGHEVEDILFMFTSVFIWQKGSATWQLGPSGSSAILCRLILFVSPCLVCLSLARGCGKQSK